MQIEVEVKGQRIKRLNSPGSVEDTLNYLTCHFTFDGEEWDNTVKTAHFENPASRKRHPKILADDGTCTVPWEALTDQGFVRFSVAGERDGYRITTGIESFYNSETVYGGEPSEPPTPSQYNQLIALAEQTKKIAESVRSDADAGKFDGEPGKPGDPGKDGVSPSAKVEQTDEGAVITVTDETGTTKAKLKNGKDGNPGRDATDEQVRTAVEAYMEEHPIQGDTEDTIKLAIKNEASGAVPITITDSAEMGVQDLEMQGWTEQASTTGAQLLDIDDFTAGESTYKWVCFKYYLTEGETYTVCNNGEIPINFKISNAQGGFSSVGNPNFVGAYTFVMKRHENVSSDAELYIYIWINTDDVVIESTDDLMSVLRESNIMLNLGSESKPYEPYTGGQPSPSPDYPQEIVSAGKYDEGTGKYQYTIKISDSEESPTKSQTVTLTADRPLTKWDKLEKRNGQWGWVYKSAEIVLDGSETWFLTGATSDEYQGFALKSSDYNAMNSNLRLVCDKFAYSTSDKINTCRQAKSEYGLRFVVSIEYVPNKTVADWENWLQSNPITVLYQLAEPTFVPLSESEQEALNALHTYYPTTMLSNDAGCEMTIKYIADTKAYIDSKIAAIQAAIINTI